MIESVDYEAEGCAGCEFLKVRPMLWGFYEACIKTIEGKLLQE